MDVPKYAVTDKDDKEKINLMYLPFPANKNINPKHWESKLKFWTTEIIKSCRFYGDICLSCERLRDIFCDENKRSPAGLFTVLGELYNSGGILLASNFGNYLDETWSEWGFNVLSRSGSWLWRGLWYRGSFHEQTSFVVKELLEEYSLALLAAHYKQVKYERTDNIVPWNVIQTVYRVNGKTLRQDNLVCIISYLKSKGKCKVSITDTGEKVVKFLARDTKIVTPLTTTDYEIIKLKKAIAKLTLECNQSDKDFQRLHADVKKCVHEKELEKAKRLLVEKRKLEKTLKMKNDALFSMKEHLRNIQETETTIMIANAFNSSATLLNNSFKEQGLTVDHVDDIMDKAAEANEMVDDIAEALSAGIKRLDVDYDIEELEKELEEIDMETQDLSTTEKGILNLPSVPDHYVKEKAKVSSKIREEAVSTT